MKNNWDYKHVAIVVDWYGPFTRQEAVTESPNYGLCLYMMIGRRNKKARKRKLTYIGVTKNVAGRFRQHPQFNEFVGSPEIWLGLVASAGLHRSVRNARRQAVELAEWLHVHLLCIHRDSMLGLNVRKRKPPRCTITLVTHWWKAESTNAGNAPYKSFKAGPYPDWPFVLDYYGSNHQGTKTVARLAWMEGSFQRISRHL